MTRLLILDDQVEMAPLLHGIARAVHPHIQVDIVPDTQAARQVLAHGDVDVLVSDHRLDEETDGVTFCHEIQGHRRAPMIVVMSGVIDPELAHRAATLGIQHLATKPMDLAEWEAFFRDLPLGTAA